MSSIEEGFLLGFEVTTATIVDSIDLDRGSMVGFGQVFFKEEGLTIMDLDRHLRFLSRNPTLKLEVISSSSQIIGGTSTPTLASGLLLEDEEDKEDEEDGEARDGVLALWTGRVTYFLFL